MGKAQRNRTLSASQRIEAQRAAARRAGTRRRLLTASAGVVVVLALVMAIVVTKLVQQPAKAGPAQASSQTSAALAQHVADVPLAAFDAVGAGTASGLKAISGQPELTENGKPEVLYIGGEYCPCCAAERWAIAAALSRFGAFTGLRFIHSSPADVYPRTPTLSFYQTSYTSKYLTFVPVEWYGEASDPSTPFQHVYLEQPTPHEVGLFDKYGGAFPFLNIANQYLLPQTSYLPSALTGLSWSQVVADMHDPSSSVARDIDGAANIITAAICKVTGGQPASVCASPGVTAARGKL